MGDEVLVGAVSGLPATLAALLFASLLVAPLLARPAALLRLSLAQVVLHTALVALLARGWQHAPLYALALAGCLPKLLLLPRRLRRLDTRPPADPRSHPAILLSFAAAALFASVAQSASHRLPPGVVGHADAFSAALLSIFVGAVLAAASSRPVQILGLLALDNGCLLAFAALGPGAEAWLPALVLAEGGLLASCLLLAARPQDIPKPEEAP